MVDSGSCDPWEKSLFGCHKSAILATWSELSRPTALMMVLPGPLLGPVTCMATYFPSPSLITLSIVVASPPEYWCSPLPRTPIGETRALGSIGPSTSILKLAFKPSTLIFDSICWMETTKILLLRKSARVAWATRTSWGFSAVLINILLKGTGVQNFTFEVELELGLEAIINFSPLLFVKVNTTLVARPNPLAPKYKKSLPWTGGTDKTISGWAATAPMERRCSGVCSGKV